MAKEKWRSSVGHPDLIKINKGEKRRYMMWRDNQKRKDGAYPMRRKDGDITINRAYKIYHR
jgi:hypothetical protein